MMLFQKLRLLLIWFTYSALTLRSDKEEDQGHTWFFFLRSQKSFFSTCGPDPLQSSLSPPPAAISEASSTESFPHPHCVYQVQIRHIHLMHWVFTQPKICLLWLMSQCEDRDSHMEASSSDQIKICTVCLYYCHLAPLKHEHWHIYCTSIRETKQTKRP